MDVKGCFVSVLLVEEALCFVVGVETNVELMTFSFMRQRIFGLLVNAIAELADEFFIDGEFNGDDVHGLSRG